MPTFFRVSNTISKEKKDACLPIEDPELNGIESQNVISAFIYPSWIGDRCGDVLSEEEV